MARSVHNPWLHRFALLTSIATLVLIGVGGLVTSKGVGMSVPDWPTTYGYNMFFFPISKWQGGIFWEHIPSARGFGGWPFDRHSRGLALGEGIPPLAALAWCACFFAVVLQGVLGGLRVVLFKDEIGIFHAALAQSFLVSLCAIALFTSRWWRNLPATFAPVVDHKNLRRLLLIGASLIFAQLVLGATMRHQHAGLSISDFPLAYGKLWPAMDPASVASYNQNRFEVEAVNPITAFQIGLQMVHRLVALLIFCAVALCAWSARRQLGARHPLAKLSLAWLGLIVLQIVLGASTIWSHKAADIATAHVVVGALSLVTGALLTIVSFRVLIPVRAAAPAATESAHAPMLSGKPAASTRNSKSEIESYRPDVDRSRQCRKDLVRCFFRFDQGAPHVSGVADHAGGFLSWLSGPLD